jgi:hypothetical protein
MNRGAEALGQLDHGADADRVVRRDRCESVALEQQLGRPLVRLPLKEDLSLRRPGPLIIGEAVVPVIDVLPGEEVMRRLVEPLERLLTREVRRGIDMHLASPSVQHGVDLPRDPAQDPAKVGRSVRDRTRTQERLRRLNKLGSGEYVGDGGRQAPVRVRLAQTIRQPRDLLVARKILKHLGPDLLVAG